jgi:hypothetical protein
MPDVTENIAPVTETPATNEAAVTAAAVTQSVESTTPAEHEITLTQFGIEFSKSERRVELMNAFIFMERQAGVIKDIKSAYLARFDAFVNKPVPKG